VKSVLQLRALARICRRLGGKLAIVSSHDFLSLVEADDDICLPFTAGSRFEYGIHWEKKIIYAVRDTRHIGFIIHEAGHVFADQRHPDDDKCDEWAWLGWEITVARRLGAWHAWSRQNGNYHLGDGLDSGLGKDKNWYGLSAKERHAVIADRVAHAKKIGVVSKRGAPKSIRRGRNT
jgi:hypothetical protein